MQNQTTTNNTTTQPNHSPFPQAPGKLPLPEKFKLGQILVTPGAAAAFVRAYGKHGDLAPALANMDLLERHVKGDYGDLDSHDKRVNERAIKQGSRIVSAYHLPNRDEEQPYAKGEKLYIITEYNRSGTTVMLADEY